MRRTIQKLFFVHCNFVYLFDVCSSVEHELQILWRQQLFPSRFVVVEESEVLRTRKNDTLRIVSCHYNGDFAGTYPSAWQ